jgi:hypothetical protein
MTQFSKTTAVIELDPVSGKYACTLANVRLGLSKHKDYFEFHYRRGDLPSLNEKYISEFVYLNPDSSVELIVVAKQPKGQAKTVIAPIALEATQLDSSTAEQHESIDEVLNPRRQRGRPKTDQPELPVNVQRNTLSDEDPIIINMLTPADRHKIKAEYNKLVYNGVSINAAIVELMTTYKLTRNQVYSFVV